MTADLRSVTILVPGKLHEHAVSRIGDTFRLVSIERIDPGLLADVVIKATALQERANAALRAKESAYRIDEITVTATIPPQIGFTISRVGDPVESGAAATAVDSATLIESGALAASPDVVADLDASAPEPEVG